MNTLLPLTIIVVTGATCGVIMHAKVQRAWLATTLAAALTGLLWCTGCLVLLRSTAPAESFQGTDDTPLLIDAFVISTAIAAVPAGLVTVLRKGVRNLR